MSRLLILFALLPAPLCAEPTEVIHILNLHFITQEEFANDLGIELGDYARSIKIRSIYASPTKDKKIDPIVRFPAKIQKRILEYQKN